MLQIGDKVVYPMHGAGVISGIENCEVLGEGKSYYVLEMPLGNMKVMIPTDNADNVGLREVIPQQKVNEVREVLEETGYVVRLGLRLPTIERAGRLSDSSRPRTYSTVGGSGIFRSA